VTELSGPDHKAAERYYDDVYYADQGVVKGPSAHHVRFAKRLGLKKGARLLDVACGMGGWLKAAREAGAVVSGLDISIEALRRAHELLPGADIRKGSAETLPWASNTFDVLTCLGALEHFPKPELALQEMRRVLKPDGTAILLVPNADFLTRRLGLFKGTEQRHMIEVVRSITEWEALFESCGLKTVERWKDLHVLSWKWIRCGAVWTWPVRAAQALALSLWPLRWQYQIYFRCLPVSDYDSG